MVGGTPGWVWASPSALEAGTINICKAYANSPEERQDNDIVAGMSEEILETIYPQPPSFHR